MRICALMLLLLGAAGCANSLAQNEEDTRRRLEALLLGPRVVSASSAVICGNQGYCIVFRTAATYAGTAVGGISGADAKCNADGNKPAGTGTYKAIITDGSQRIACTTADCGTGGASEHVDWSMYALTEYRRTNLSTVICTTNANGICPIGTAANGWDGTASSFHTGFNSNWTASGGNHCTAWTVGGGSGMQGVGNVTSAAMLANMSIGCASSVSILCAQQ